MSNSELCGAGGCIPVSKDCKQHPICDRCDNQLRAAQPFMRSQ